MIGLKWVGNLVRKFRDAKIQADYIRESNSDTIRDLALCAERDCDTKQAQALAEALDSVSINMSQRLNGDTDKTKKKETGV